MYNLQVLSDRIEIAEQLARWCELVDTKKPEQLGEVFLEDVTWDFGSGVLGTTVVETSLEAVREKIRTHIVTNPTCGATMHNLMNTVIRVDGDSAESMTNVFAEHAGAGAFEGQHCLMWLTYNDFWTRTAAGWRIAKRIYRIKITKGNVALLGFGE